MKLIIYGAKSMALGAYRAIRAIYPEQEIGYFMVKSLQGNPTELAGLPVKELETVSKELSVLDKQELMVLVGTPEALHEEIEQDVKACGFYHVECLDSKRMAALMEQYFTVEHLFPSLHQLPRGEEKVEPFVIMTKFYKDRPLKKVINLPPWAHPLQVGAALTEERVAELLDNTGEHISEKNVNYCELTGLYWLWQQIKKNNEKKSVEEEEYYGLFHYRRILDIGEEDLFRIKESKVDVILPYPLMHEPSAEEHHTRYVKSSDWEALMQVLQEYYPEYAESFLEVLKQPYLYNYNIFVARKEIVREYCQWLFDVLEKVEEYSEPKGWERADRYLGYLGENLLTLYFMVHKDRLKIVHTGCIMLT